MNMNKPEIEKSFVLKWNLQRNCINDYLGQSQAIRRAFSNSLKDR